LKAPIEPAGSPRGTKSEKGQVFIAEVKTNHLISLEFAATDKCVPELVVDFVSTNSLNLPVKGGHPLRECPSYSLRNGGVFTEFPPRSEALKDVICLILFFFSV